MDHLEYYKHIARTSVGTVADTWTRIATGTFYNIGLKVHDGYAYISQNYPFNILKMDTTTGAYSVFVTGEDSAGGMGINGTDLIFATRGGHIKKADLATGTVTIVGTFPPIGANYCAALAVAGGYVYFSIRTGGTGEVYKMNLATGARSILTTGMIYSNGAVVHGAKLYIKLATEIWEIDTITGVKSPLIMVDTTLSNIDAANGFLYVPKPNIITKINIATLDTIEIASSSTTGMQISISDTQDYAIIDKYWRYDHIF
jgi:hypothetical protein